MSSKYEGKNLMIPEQYDRRRKLTTEDYEEIIRLYAVGDTSYNKLARKYGVSKTRIMQICNPTVANRYKRYAKEHRADFQPTREKHAEYTRKHRAYKRKLGDNNLLIAKEIK